MNTKLYTLLCTLLCISTPLVTGDKTQQQESRNNEVSWRKVGVLYCQKGSSPKIVEFINLHAPADPNEEILLDIVSCNNEQHPQDCANWILFVQNK